MTLAQRVISGVRAAALDHGRGRGRSGHMSTARDAGPSVAEFQTEVKLAVWCERIEPGCLVRCAAAQRAGKKHEGAGGNPFLRTSPARGRDQDATLAGHGARAPCKRAVGRGSCRSRRSLRSVVEQTTMAEPASGNPKPSSSTASHDSSDAHSCATSAATAPSSSAASPSRIELQICRWAGRDPHLPPGGEAALRLVFCRFSARFRSRIAAGGLSMSDPDLLSRRMLKGLRERPPAEDDTAGMVEYLDGPRRMRRPKWAGSFRRCAGCTAASIC